MYYYESIFPKKDVHAFLVFITNSTINLSGLAYIECTYFCFFGVY